MSHLQSVPNKSPNYNSRFVELIIFTDSTVEEQAVIKVEVKLEVTETQETLVEPVNTMR